MSNKEVYDQLYKTRGYPIEYQEYLYPLFEEIISRVSTRISSTQGVRKTIDLSISLQYLVEEHIFNMHLLDANFIKSFMMSKEYYDHIKEIVSDKIFFNE